MAIRTGAAQGLAALSRFALKNVLHRAGENFPGKLALYVDPQLISHLSPSLTCGSICVVGTNGKTTTSNLIADSLQQAGFSVCCNRTGANLDSGVASALLESGHAQWGVIECDELWLPKVLPGLQANYLVLLNLFRDQLDRAGEIDIVQDAIARALEQSPSTTLIFNADDPLCTAVAQRVSNPRLAFGIAESLELAQNSVADAQICQNCSSLLDYDFHQYGQLGSYHCPACGFARPALDYTAADVTLGAEGASFKLRGPYVEASFQANLPGSYMVYNLTATAAAASLAGCNAHHIQQAIGAFSPQNGRLERLQVAQHSVLVNLAKNPTGMNQNLRIALSDSRPFVLGVFINDKEADGHDVSWLWDTDFQELASRPDVHVFAGGIRKHDMQVRFKYAGVPAGLVEDAAQLIAFAEGFGAGVPVYAIANYTALPALKAQMEALAADASTLAPQHAAIGALPREETECDALQPVIIAHLFPELLNLYGDGGNVTTLRRRLEWRGIPVEVRPVRDAAGFDFSDVDLVFLGGAPDREQEIASRIIMEYSQKLVDYLNEDGPCLAICGGYQMLGRNWLLNGETVPGVSAGAFETRRAGTSRDRLVDNIALSVPGISHPVIGYENHAGRTYLDSSDQAFGQVISKTGHGNNDESRTDGYASGNLIATYLHGPLLPKNPEVADRLLAAALQRWSQRTGNATPSLAPLDDAAELAANDFMATRLL